MSPADWKESYDNIDWTKFRDDLDREKMIKIIELDYAVFCRRNLNRVGSIEDVGPEILQEADEYFALLKKCFYKRGKRKMFIEVSGLKKSYTTGEVKTEVLKGIDLKLGKGEIQGSFLGPSGSGKSTLINIIGGVDRGDSGRVIVDETEVSKMNDEELTEYRRAEIGLSFSSII